MDQITLRIDLKGRMCIPAEIIEEIGKVVTLKKTSEGFLIIPGNQDFLKEFERIIRSKYERTGKPENWRSEKMKSIWTQTR
jgi:DNA-binding transcriptional regulator/RsmH inhibitor MraZ